MLLSVRTSMREVTQTAYTHTQCWAAFRRSDCSLRKGSSEKTEKKPQDHGTKNINLLQLLPVQCVQQICANSRWITLGQIACSVVLALLFTMRALATDQKIVAATV